MQRCDLEVNCPDQSDERLCTPVVVPKDYISEVGRRAKGWVTAGSSSVEVEVARCECHFVER